MNAPVKVLVIQKSTAGWLVKTYGGIAPHYDGVFQRPEEIAAELPRLMQQYLCAPLPPQPETPPPTT